MVLLEHQPSAWMSVGVWSYDTNSVSKIITVSSPSWQRIASTKRSPRLWCLVQTASSADPFAWDIQRSLQSRLPDECWWGNDRLQRQIILQTVHAIQTHQVGRENLGALRFYIWIMHKLPDLHWSNPGPGRAWPWISRCNGLYRTKPSQKPHHVLFCQ